jgi:hypothetical protein
MSYRLCSIHHAPLVRHQLAGMWLMSCPHPDCSYRRTCKHGPRLAKSRPAFIFRSLSDKIKMRDRVQVAKRVSHVTGASLSGPHAVRTEGVSPSLGGIAKIDAALGDDKVDRPIQEACDEFGKGHDQRTGNIYLNGTPEQQEALQAEIEKKLNKRS